MPNEDVVDNERVVLNVGGVIHETYVETLRRYPRSLLGTMFAERNRAMLKKDSDGRYFFDRDGEVFSIILNFYRIGRIIPKPSISPEALQAELEFFALNSYVEAENRSNNNNGNNNNGNSEEMEEDMSGFGAEIAKIVKQKTREKHWKNFRLLKRQFRQALLHAATRSLLTVDIIISSSGHTYFGEDLDGNLLYEIRNDNCFDIFDGGGGERILFADLRRMGLDVCLLPTRPDGRIGLRFFLWKDVIDSSSSSDLERGGMRREREPWNRLLLREGEDELEEEGGNNANNNNNETANVFSPTSTISPSMNSPTNNSNNEEIY